MTELTETQMRLADALFDVGAIKFGEFRLKLHETSPDAPLSPIYLNLRTPENPKSGPLTPEIVDMVGIELLWIVCAQDLHPRHICGIPNAGDPFAANLAQKMHAFPVRLLTLTKSGDAANRRVTAIAGGEYEHGERVILIDDLITRADSKFEALDVVERHGLVARDVVVLVDREQGGRQELETKGYVLHAAFTLSQLVAYYAQTSKICPRMRDKVARYVAENR